VSGKAVSSETVTDPAALDDTDRHIIDLLREDARRTISDIAQAVNLSPAPVKRRIDRLEQLGVIAGYTVVLNQAKLGPSVDAFVELRMRGNASLDEITEAVTGIPEVREVFTVAGDPDALVRIRMESVAHLKDVVNALRLSGRVTGTKTLMVLDHWSRARAGADQARAARPVRVRSPTAR
jgi:Lrp/AsnC family leucine-responsive transcriptional regulator